MQHGTWFGLPLGRQGWFRHRCTDPLRRVTFRPW